MYKAILFQLFNKFLLKICKGIKNPSSSDNNEKYVLSVL